MADQAVILAVKQPGMRAEWDLYELGLETRILDKRCWGDPVRDYPGDGLIIVPDIAQNECRDMLEMIDGQWEDQLEILDDPGRQIERRLLRYP